MLERLELDGDETVLDAGCGSGLVTEALAERVPRGRVIAVDGSPAMIRQTRRRLGDRVDCRVADLTELDLGDERVDVIFSSATFHWIADHDRLFTRLRGALRDGGRLVAQCGGTGQVAPVVAALEELVPGSPWASCLEGFNPWTFAGVDETERRLRAAGFVKARAWLTERDVKSDEPAAYLRTMILGAHLDRLPEPLREPLVDAVAARLATPLELTYVRLNIDAVA